MKNNQNTTNLTPLIAVYSLFFIWGFIWALGGGVILPFFNGKIELSNLEQALTPFASFAAFFIFSIPSKTIVDKLKPKRAMLLGLLIMASGMLLVAAGAFALVYLFALAGLFVAFAGITLLTVVATPYVAALGKQELASSRINFGQGLGALGATIAPALAGFLVFGKLINNPDQGMIVFFALMVLVLLLQWFILGRLTLPSINLGGEPENNNTVTTEVSTKKSALQYPHLVLAVVALFLYMGAEAILGNLLGSYLVLDGKGGQIGLTPEAAGQLLSLFWGSVMIGRFAGAAILTKMRPALLVLIFAVVAAALVSISYLSTGYVAVASILGVGFFASILYSTIFALGIEGLGKFTAEGSSYCAMAISGGAVLPLIQGVLADTSLGLEKSFFIVLIIPIAVAALYGFSRLGKK